MEGGLSLSSQYTNDSFTDIFIYETSQNIQLLEQIALSCETGGFTEDSLNEIFRLVNTIKGSASMMLYSNISNVSHKLEDLFFFLRERPDIKYDNEELSEIVLCVIDFIKTELEKVKAGNKPDGNPDKTAEDIHLFLSRLKGENGGKGCQNNQNKTKRKLKSYRAVVFFL
jgi:two-component system chemotaxis sensor kinase CheA